MMGAEFGGVASTSGSGLFTALSGTATKSIDATTKFDSDYALKIVASSNYGLFQLAHGGSSPTYSVGVAYVYFDSLPAATDYVFFRIQTAGGSNYSFAYNNSTGKMRALITSGTVQTGPDMTTGVWYRIEWKAYCGSASATLDWSVGIEDGAATAYTQATGTITASTFASIQFGNSSVNSTWTGYCDNIVWSQTSTDYPIGPVRVEGIRPSSEGTDSLGSVITDEDGLTTSLYAKLSESPWATTANDDLIKQTGTGTTSYAEVNFADTTRTTILGAKGYLQYASSATQSNQGACIIIDEDTTQTEIYGNPTTRQDYSETSAFYKSTLLPVPSGGWDQAAVNALKARVGYSGDANPNPYWLALMVEVAYTPSSGINLVPDSTGYHSQLGDEATLGVTIDLVPDGTGYHSQLGDSPTLGVTIDMVPDGTGYQTQLGDGATLQLPVDVVPDQTAYQSQAGDNAVLGVSINLVPDSTGYQSQAGDEVTGMTQVHILAPDGTGYHSQLGDSPTLGVTIDLAPDSTGYQTQLGDNATLEVGVISIVPAEGVQTQAGDSPTLGVTIDLVPDSTGFQSQLGDNAVLSVGAIDLVPDSTGYHSQLGDNAVLGVTIPLVPAEGVQTQLGDEATLTVGAIDLIPDQTGSQVQSGDGATITVDAINLVPDSTGYQSQLGDTATITRIFNLIPSEGVQTQLGDGATLGVTIGLVPQEGYQNQAGDGAALVQTHNLLPDQGVQTQLGDEATLILGVLHYHEVIERVIVKSGIETIRTGRSAEFGIFLELVQVQGRIKTVRKRRIQ